MSTAITVREQLPQWVSAEEFRAAVPTPGGPEIDYGMRWGDRRDIRVSFAPHIGRGGGFLYAHDPSTDRYLVLARQTTAEQVRQVWPAIVKHTSSPDGYLAFAALDYQHQPLSLRHAQALAWHCIDRELIARRDLECTTGGNARFDAAHALVTARSSRLAAEELLLDAARAAAPDHEPVVVRYRILDRPDSSGRLPATDLASAATDTQKLLQLAQRHGLSAQATSLAHGHTTVAAARVPELTFAAVRNRVPSHAPVLSV